MADIEEKKEELKPEHKSALYTIWSIIDNIVYFIVLIPLLIVCLSVVYQSIRYPDKIPHIFGYKLFIIIDDYMDDNVVFGDLIFTKNIEPETLKVDNIIAFRNGMDTVTVHRINEINEEFALDEKTHEERMIRTFSLNSAKNETLDTKSTTDSKVEGILVKRIPKLGYIIYILQQPLMIFGIICIILSFGLIIYYVAQQLDLRDEAREKALEEAKEAKEKTLEEAEETKEKVLEETKEDEKVESK